MVPSQLTVPLKPIVIIVPLLSPTDKNCNPVVPVFTVHLEVLAEVNGPEEVVIVTEGLTVPLEMVDVDAIVGATAFAVGAARNETPAATKRVTDTNEIILFNMEGPLNAVSLLDATSAKFKRLSENEFVY